MKLNFKKVMQGKSLKNAVLGVTVLGSLFTDTTTKANEVEFTVSEEVYDKYVIYQERATGVDLSEEVKEDLATIVGNVPFVLPAGLIPLHLHCNNVVPSYKQSVTVEEGLNTIRVEYEGFYTEVDVLGVVSSRSLKQTIPFKKYEPVMYADVKEGYWGSDAVYFAVVSNYMQGTSDTLFGVNEEVLREDVFAIFNSLLLDKYHTNLNTSRIIIEDLYQFIDDTNTNRMNTLNVLAKMNGETALKYTTCLDIYKDKITRLELADILYGLFESYIPYEIDSKVNYSDMRVTNKSIDFVTSVGLLEGYDNKFNPTAYVTKVELATVLKRLTDKLD